MVNGIREERLMQREGDWKEYELGNKTFERKDEKVWDRRKIQGQCLGMEM